MQTRTAQRLAPPPTQEGLDLADGKASITPLVDRVKALQQVAVHRRSETMPPPPPPAPAETPVRTKPRGGYPVLAKARESVQAYSRQHQLRFSDLVPGNEVPTILTRIPLFPPVQRTRADEKNGAAVAKGRVWIPMDSRWSKGVYRSGPALVTYDEDTLLGLLKLRSFRLSGHGQKLPLPAFKSSSKLSTNSTQGDSVEVHALHCTISQLESVIQGKTPSRGWGGRALKKRRESLDRLAAIRLKFEHDMGKTVLSGAHMNLLSALWETDGYDACVYVQFDPRVSEWLDTVCTYLNFNIRRELTPLGKALHRFLCSQRAPRRPYEEDLMRIYEAIGADTTVNNFKTHVLKQLQRMVDLGFLASGTVTGTGRKIPFRLIVVFADNVSKG
jgi:hypothetical protein